MLLKYDIFAVKLQNKAFEEKEKSKIMQGMDFSKRYSRNMNAISSSEQDELKQKSVCVMGCGGLGGGVIENLARVGVGKLTVVDGDVFEETNLNRQVFSNEKNLGKSKAKEVVCQIKEINSEVEIIAHHMLMDVSNVEMIISGHDLVVDALDNINGRLILEKACGKLQLPIVHGAIGGWCGQVGVVMPGSGILSSIYGNESHESDVSSGNLSFAAATVSGIQAAEVIKLLLGKEVMLENKMLMIDLIYHEYEVIEF